MIAPSSSAEAYVTYLASIDIQLGYAIGRVRKQKNISLHEFSELTGFPTETLCDIERGEYPVLASQLIHIAGELSVSLPEILSVADIDSIKTILEGLFAQGKARKTED